MTNDPTIPDDWRKLPVPMPPMLPEVIGVTGDSRYFSLSYEGSKAFWFDGRTGCTFSYFSAYQPYVEHLTMAIHLFEVDLGSDDGPPTHALLIDRQEAQVYVGDYDEVQRFLRKQHPPQQPLTPDELAEIEERFATLEQMNVEQMQELGMFEFMLGSTEQQKDKCWALVEWLDGLVTEDLLKAYLAASEAGNYEALHHLILFKRRIEASRQPGNDSPLVH
jgi:hypothetical protein